MHQPVCSHLCFYTVTHTPTHRMLKGTHTHKYTGVECLKYLPISSQHVGNELARQMFVFVWLLQEKVWCHCSWTADCWPSCLQVVVRRECYPSGTRTCTHTTQISASAVEGNHVVILNLGFTDVKAEVLVCVAAVVTASVVLIVSLPSDVIQSRSVWSGLYEACKSSSVICTYKYCP